MPKHLIRVGESKPISHMPHAAYPDACRVRLYAAWESPKLFRPDDSIGPFGIDLRAVAGGVGVNLSAGASPLDRRRFVCAPSAGAFRRISKAIAQPPSGGDSAATAACQLTWMRHTQSEYAEHGWPHDGWYRCKSRDGGVTVKTIRHSSEPGMLLDIASYGRRGPGRRDRLSAAETELISRTVRRAPEVMVKVLTRGG